MKEDVQFLKNETIIKGDLIQKLDEKVEFYKTNWETSQAENRLVREQLTQLQEQLNVTISESMQIEQNGQLMLEKSATIEKEIHELQLRIAPESCEQLAHQGITESKNVFLDPDGRYKKGFFHVSTFVLLH